MKKMTTLILAISMMICGCKKKDAVEPMPFMTKSTVVDCENNPVMKELNSLPTNEAVLDWLRQHGNKICSDSLYLCIEDRHIITAGTYERYVSAHPDNNPAIRNYSLQWGDIENFIESNEMACYQKYLGFDFKGGNITMKSLPFTESETCYSVPLLRGIQQRHKLSATDNLTFTKAHIPDPARPGIHIEKVIIKYVGTSGTSYYDLCDDPR